MATILQNVSHLFRNFNANRQDLTQSPTTTSSLLPLFQEDAATIAMVRHPLDVIKKVTELVHPGQAPVVPMDQPLFTIAKNIQWTWPSVHEESKFVITFGGMHIESAALETVGNLLESSGWTGALVQACVPTSGKADSFLKAAHITWTRRAHEVTACFLYLTLEEAHQEHVKPTEPNTEPMSLEDWCTVQQESQPMFKLWFLVLQLQLTILVFVRSIRSGNFPLYIQSLTKLVHCFFTFDHYHYMHGEYQFTSVIWWLCLICIQTYIENSWRDTSQSRRRVMIFQTWLSTKHMSKIMLLWRMMVELLA